MRHLLTSLCIILSSAVVEAQHSTTIPKLVVTITIDELRGDMLELMNTAFGEKGFRRLQANGAYAHNIHYGYPKVDRTNSLATLFAGSTPFYHGVISQTIWNKEKAIAQQIVHDPKFIGNYSTTNVSPICLNASNLTDELKVAYDGFSQVICIAPHPDQALMMGGHAADGVFWLDDESGKWATTTYYKTTPTSFERYNREMPPSSYIDTARWVPDRPIDFYRFIPSQRRDFGFKYSFPVTQKGRINEFKTSGLLNREVVRFASFMLKEQKLGNHLYPDMLQISLSANNYLNKDILDLPIEAQDIYLRLDQSIGELLDLIDRQVGLQHTIVMIASNGSFDAQEQIGERYQIPTGEFYSNRATALLNFYLMSVYGNEEWVKGYHNEEIFLNRKKIEEKQLSITEVEKKSAEFLALLTGVKDVVASHTLMQGVTNDDQANTRNGFSRILSGDLFIEVQPGWKIKDESRKGSDIRYVRKLYHASPFMIMGAGFDKGVSLPQINATAVASTLAYALRIRPPNSCNQQPLIQLFKANKESNR